MRDAFLDLLRIVSVYWQNCAQIAVENRAARELEFADIGKTVRRQIAVAHVIFQATADRTPVFVERRNREQIGNVNLLHERLAVRK